MLVVLRKQRNCSGSCCCFVLNIIRGVRVVAFVIVRGEVLFLLLLMSLLLLL